MKPFDIRPAFIEKPSQGQQALGGHNSANNCVPDSLLECYQALTGKWPINPQQITTAIYGARYWGGETYLRVTAWMKAHPELFPELPELEVHDFGSAVPADYIGEMGALGYPMCASFYSDTNGFILPRWTPILHSSCPVASDSERMVVWNVEGYEQHFILPDFHRAYNGALVIFKRSVHGRVNATAGGEVVVPQPPPIQEETMQNFGPFDGNSHFGGIHTATDVFGPGYRARDMYLVLSHDSDYGAGVDVEILWVPSDFVTSKNLAGRNGSIKLAGSAQQSFKAPDNFDGMAVIKHNGGDKYDVAIKTEFR